MLILMSAIQYGKRAEKRGRKAVGLKAEDNGSGLPGRSGFIRIVLAVLFCKRFNEGDKKEAKMTILIIGAGVIFNFPSSVVAYGDPAIHNLKKQCIQL